MKVKELKSALNKISRFGNYTFAVLLDNDGRTLDMTFAYTSSTLSFQMANYVPKFKARVILKPLLAAIKKMPPLGAMTVKDAGDSISLHTDTPTMDILIPKLKDDEGISCLAPIWESSIGIDDSLFKILDKMNRIPLDFGSNRELPLNQIHLTPNYVEIASTRFVWRTSISDGYLNEPNYLIPQCLDYIGKITGGAIAKDKKGESWIIWMGDNLQYAKKLILGDYPKVSNIIPTKPTMMFKLSAPALLLEKIKVPNCLDPQTPEEGGGAIWFKVMNQNAIKVTLNKDKEVSELGDFPASVGDVKAGMKIGFTTSTVAYAFKLGYTTVRITGEITPAVFTNGAGFIVRMPVKLA